MNKMIWVFAVGLILSSCSFYQIKSVEESSTPMVATPKNSFLDVAFVPEATQPYEVIGTLRVTTEKNRSLDDVIRKMKMQAAVLGGDAVTEVMVDPESFEDKGANSKLRVDYVGKVIVYQ